MPQIRKQSKYKKLEPYFRNPDFKTFLNKLNSMYLLNIKSMYLTLIKLDFKNPDFKAFLTKLNSMYLLNINSMYLTSQCKS